MNQLRSIIILSFVLFLSTQTSYAQEETIHFEYSEEWENGDKVKENSIEYFDESAESDTYSRNENYRNNEDYACETDEFMDDIYCENYYSHKSCRQDCELRCRQGRAQENLELIGGSILIGLGCVLDEISIIGPVFEIGLGSIFCW